MTQTFAVTYGMLQLDATVHYDDPDRWRDFEITAVSTMYGAVDLLPIMAVTPEFEELVENTLRDIIVNKETV